MTTIESLRKTASNPHVSDRVRHTAARLAYDLGRGRIGVDWAAKLLVTALCVDAGVA